MRFLAWFGGEKEMEEDVPTTQPDLISPRTADAAGELTESVVGPRGAHPHSPSPAPASTVPCLFAHNATSFACGACDFVSRHHAELRTHRASQHRDLRFFDAFHGACACSEIFTSRAAATKHAQTCADSQQDQNSPMEPAEGAPALSSEPSAAAPHATVLSPSIPTLSRLESSPNNPTDDHAPPSIVPDHEYCDGKRRKLNPPTEDELMTACPPSPTTQFISRAIAEAQQAPHDDYQIHEPDPEPTLPETAAARAHTDPANTAASQLQAPRTDPDTAQPPWLLRFDGACPKSRGPGGAGSALFNSDNVSVWTCSRYLPDKTNTNNSAEYTALIDGLHGALAHGATHLDIEGDSNLVIEQVLGHYSCSSKRLRQFRDTAIGLLERLQYYSINHIDRLLNKQADALANKALARKRNTTACATHSPNASDCWTPTASTRGNAPRPSSPPPPAVSRQSSQASSSPAPTDNDDEEDLVTAEDRSRLNGGREYPTITTGRGAAPARLPRLRLRPLSEQDLVQAELAIKGLSQELSLLIRDCESWSSGEGYISALPSRIREVLQPFSRGGTQARQQPRTEPSPSDERLQEALTALKDLQRLHPKDQGRIRSARRRVGRIKAAMKRVHTRHQFNTSPRQRVQNILASARTSSTDAHDSPQCPISASEISQYFQGTATPSLPFVFDSPAGTPFRQALDKLPRATEKLEALTDSITTDEIEDVLLHVSTTSSPGLDGIDYAIYKKFQLQLAPVLHEAFNFCWRHQRIPATWKVGATRLIYKKGDPKLPQNWRPICLQQCIYKIYASIVARRLTEWMEENHRISGFQKGFRSMNGCSEHNFVASSLLDQTRRLNKQLFVVWYDLKNAFGSIPQDLLWSVLERMGANRDFVARLRNIYTDSYFVITNPAEGLPTEPILQSHGVYQGCPISPYLFLAATTPLLHALESLQDGVPLAPNMAPNATAYADDLKVFSSTADGIQRAHAMVMQFLKWSTLAANPAKCAFLQPPTPTRGRTAALSLEIDGSPIPVLGPDDSYKYLGVGDGINHTRRAFQLDGCLTQMRKEMHALFTSNLAPWQVFSAMKTYIYPQIEYALRHLRPPASQLQAFDQALVRRIKWLLRLPKSATTSFIYAPTSSGGLGFLPLTDLHAALQTSHAFQMLHSPDPAIRSIARTQVLQVVRKRNNLDEDYWRQQEDEAVQQFLNSTLHDSPYVRPKRSYQDIGSIWIDVRRHLKNYDLRLDADPANTDTPLLQLKVPHFDKWLTPKTVFRRIKIHMKLKHYARWKGMKDQGRTARAHGNVGSKFITSGEGLSDTDYRFAIRARLNQIETRATLKRQHLRSNASCRNPNCTNAETLAHVLNHCSGNHDAIRSRHDQALKRIQSTLMAAVQRSKGALDLRVDQVVPDFNGPALRPDIQLYNSTTKTAAIVDLAIAFEDQPTDRIESSSLQYAKQHKILKYEPIKKHLERQGWKVQLSAIVYGSLGSVLPSNYKTYTDALGTTKKNAHTLDKRISTSCITSSRKIWHWHAGQHRQRTRANN